MLGVTQIYSSRQAHEDRGGSTGYAGWGVGPRHTLQFGPAFFFLEHAGDLHVNILRRKRVRPPGTLVFGGKNLEKKPHTLTIYSHKK